MLLLLEYLSICLFWTRYRRAAYTGIWSVVCSVGLQRLRQCSSLTYMYFRQADEVLSAWFQQPPVQCWREGRYIRASDGATAPPVLL